MEARHNTVIRVLSTEDVDAALGLSATAGWNQRVEDWRMLLRLAPAGSFAALADGRIVGTAIGIDYGGFAWIAMMLVDPAYRGRGLGRGLLEAAIGAIPSGRPIRLDATPMGRPLYERYGFEDEAMLTRHIISAATRPHQSSLVRRLTAADLKTVADLDTDVFGGQRGDLLEWALADAPRYGHIVSNGAGPAHYCLGRHGRLFDQIGPVVAGDDEIAAALVCAALAEGGGRPIAVDAFDARRPFTAALGACGFQAQRPLYRMCRPSGAAASGDARFGTRSRAALVEFAILGPEFA